MICLFCACSRVCLVSPLKETGRLFRQIDSSCLGKYSFFSATVMRVETVRPRLLVAAYECEDCHDKAFQPVSIVSACKPLTCLLSVSFLSPFCLLFVLLLSPLCLLFIFLLSPFYILTVSFLSPFYILTVSFLFHYCLLSVSF